jgi:hypothetical protein
MWGSALQKRKPPVKKNPAGKNRMRRKYSLVGLMLTLVCAATACNIGTPSPTSEPTLGILVPADTVVPTPTEAPTSLPPAYVYAVVLVHEGGTLEAHVSADSGSAGAGSLAWDAVDLHGTGNVSVIGGDAWVDLNLPGGGTGWVERKNLTEYVPSGTFCTDPGPLALFPTIGMVVNTSNGLALVALVSPVHGLAVGYIHGGTPRVFTPPELASIFTSTESVDWGLGPGSGLPVMGTFNDLVRPDLVNVLGGAYTPYCNTIQLGGASYSVQWPAEWKNINFYSLYRPGPTGDELSWMTWLAGVDYVDGLPYLFSLSRYNWEP